MPDLDPHPDRGSAPSPLERVAPATGSLSTIPLDPKVALYVEAARAPATLRAYRTDWEHFVAWCESHGTRPLPADPHDVAVYLAELADGYATSTIQRRLSAISQAHKAAGLPTPADDPLVRETHRGIRRKLASRRPKQADPLRLADLERLVTVIPTDTLAGIRDHALVLTGWWGALRRSELVRIAVEDLDFRTDGIALTVLVSKTDPQGDGHVVALPRHARPLLDPVAALRRWLDRSDTTTGPVFRNIDRHGNINTRLSGQSVNLIVKRHAEVAGLGGNFSGHSLRAGFATTAAEAGIGEDPIMRQTRHSSVSTMRRYVRDGDLFTQSAAAQLAATARRRRPQMPEEPTTAEEWLKQFGDLESL